MTKKELEEAKRFKKKIRSIQILATDLGYDPERIKKFVNAKTEIELENMLIDARRAS